MNFEKAKKALVACALVAAVAAAAIIGSTAAKYISSADGSGSATVAAWSFNVNDTDIATSDTVEFDLFSTIYDSDGTSEETDVVSSKIAPGTSGSFDLSLENTSEVTASYTVEFEVTNDYEIPIQYSTDGETYVDELSDLDLSGTLESGESASTATVYWIWEYETADDEGDVTAGDAVDTALGIAAASGEDVSITVAATITATQVD